MNNNLDQQTAPLFDALGASRTLEAMEIFNALCIAFVLSMIIANVYRWTHQGFSYQRSFIHTLVLVCIVISIMIMAIGNNMARGLGILGAMAFVRFLQVCWLCDICRLSGAKLTMTTRDSKPNQFSKFRRLSRPRECGSRRGH